LRKVALFVAVCAAWIYSVAHFYVSGIRRPLDNFYGDFLASFPSWRLSVLLGRLDLYHGTLAEEWAGAKVHGHPVWHYGPVEHLVTLPLFAFSDLRSAYIAWLIANYAFFVAIVALAMWLFAGGVPRWIRWSVVPIAFLNYLPLYEALTQRVIEIFELALVFAAFALMRRGRPAASGFLIGLAAMTKFLPLIFIPYFAIKRMWRALAGSLMAIVPIAIATEVVFGWRHSGILIQLRHGGFIDSALNQSFSGMIVRLLKWTHSSLSPAVLSRVAILAALAGLSWLFLKTRHCAGIEDLEWSTLIVAMVLLPPHNQQYYFIFLLFPYLALFAHHRAKPGRLRWLAVSFVAVGMPVPLTLVSRLTGTDAFPVYLQAGIPFLGAAILAILCASALRHAPCT